MDNQLAIRDIPATILETSSDRVGSMVTKRLDSSVFEQNVLVLHEPINVNSAPEDYAYMRKRFVV